MPLWKVLMPPRNITCNCDNPSPNKMNLEKSQKAPAKKSRGLNSLFYENRLNQFVLFSLMKLKLNKYVNIKGLNIRVGGD